MFELLNKILKNLSIFLIHFDYFYRLLIGLTGQENSKPNFFGYKKLFVLSEARSVWLIQWKARKSLIVFICDHASKVKTVLCPSSPPGRGSSNIIHSDPGQQVSFELGQVLGNVTAGVTLHFQTLNVLMAQI